MCKCGKTGVDLEEWYQRNIGKVIELERKEISKEFIDKIKNLDWLEKYLKDNNIEIEKGIRMKDWIVEQIGEEMNRKLEIKKEE